ncbi:MAG: hypothetical protein IKY28_03695 [Anaerotignum sp.]|nr:hypothetical protein [Anaerotignum sp.]
MKRKKMATVALAAVMALTAVGGFTVYGASDTKTATLNNAQVRFNNGKVQTIQCYNIDGFNFVRARDITNNLGMAVGAIQNGDTGVMVHPYQAPTSNAAPEKLTQQSAKVKVVEGNLIYDGWVSKAECFLLNGRYYFKLADFANAANTQLDVALETVEFEAKGEYAKTPYMATHNGIEVVWNNDTKVIDVNKTTTDLQQFFNDIRGGKVPTVKPDKEAANKDEVKESAADKEVKFKASGVLTSAPKEGAVLADILLDNSEGAYLANGSVNWDNLTGPYNHGSERTFGQCTWYAHGRFIETYGDMILDNVYRRGEDLAAWVKSAQDDRCPDLDGITDPNAVVPGCLAVFEGHVLFVEWVDYNTDGDPVKVYFTEANTQHNGTYYPDKDTKVKVMDLDDFIKRQPFVGYVIVK